MKVEDLMERNTFTVNINTPLKDITGKLLTEGIECILVTNNNDDVAGIITLSDLFRFIFPDYNEIRDHTEYVFDPFAIKLRLNTLGHIPAKNFMTRFPEVINKEVSVIEAAAVMKAFRIKQLPVTENGKPIGVITVKDIFSNFILENSNNVSTTI